MRDVGEMGEAEFNKLCNSVGIIYNKPQKDSRGWDAFIQFPFEFSPFVDLTPLPIKAFIQVKSTDDVSRKVQRINLKNMLNFAFDSTPAFFCLINFNKKDSPESIYILHFGKSLIEKTLRKARENSEKISSGSIKLQDIKLPIKFEARHKLELANGECLKNRIERYIPHGIIQYIEKKTKILKTIGYEDGNIICNFEIPKASIKQLLDCTLGIAEEIEVNKFSAFNKRFNIASPLALFGSESGRLIFEKIEPSGEFQVTFREQKFGVGVTVNSKLYSSIINFIVEEKDRKFRLSNNLFEMVMYPYSGSLNIEFTILANIHEPKMLNELYKMSQILKILNSGNCSYIEILIKKQNEIDFGKEDRLLVATLNATNNFKSLEKISETIYRSYQISKHYNIHDDVEIDVFNLIKKEIEIRNFFDVCINKDKRYYRSGSLDELPELIEAEKAKTKVACVIVIQIFLGDYSLVCILAVLCNQLYRDEKGALYLISNQADYHHYLMFHGDKIPTKNEQKKEIEKVVEKAESNNYFPIIFFEL